MVKRIDILVSGLDSHRVDQLEPGFSHDRFGRAAERLGDSSARTRSVKGFRGRAAQRPESRCAVGGRWRGVHRGGDGNAG